VTTGDACRLAYYPEVAFGGFSHVDGKVAFFTRVQALLNPSFVVVDAGCGRGVHAQDPIRFRRELQNLRGKCKRVIGIDVETPSTDNPLIDEFRLIEDDRWPLEDASVDLCFSQNVLEHVARPEAYFSECARVLRGNGILCIRTPNAFGYPALAARLLPNRWHAAVLRALGITVEPEDVFPTLYRCNTVRKLKAMMQRHGFEGCVYAHTGEPSYLHFSKTTYFLGVLFHRFAPRAFMPCLLAFARKTAANTLRAEKRDPPYGPAVGPWQSLRAGQRDEAA